jgi:transposase
MQERLTLSAKEQTRLVVLNEVEAGRMKARDAAEVMKLSRRHVRRLRAAYRARGAESLAHGNRGRRPHNALDAETTARVVALAKEKYLRVNQQHLTELLQEREGICLSRSSTRRVLLRAGIGSARTRRAPKHRGRRQRKPKEGMLLQVDGSPHDWLEGRGPRLCLVGAIDDATNHVPHAVFRQQEDIQGYFIVLRRIVKTKGIPLALYHDKHTIFVSPRRDEPTLQQQLEGKTPLTQLGRALEELGITSIPAESPEAKGRIERLWGTFQDRLVSELRLADARTISDANQVLKRFLRHYNRRFTVPAAEEGSAYRPLSPDINLSMVFCLKHTRTVGRDNVVCFNRRRIQVLPSRDRKSYAGATVQVHERTTNGLAVYCHGVRLNTAPAPLEASALRKNTTPPPPAAPERPPHPAPHTIPAADHPWRKPFKAQRRRRTFSLTT